MVVKNVFRGRIYAVIDIRERKIKLLSYNKLRCIKFRYLSMKRNFNQDLIICEKVLREPDV
jgi:hypothetical protein